MSARTTDSVRRVNAVDSVDELLLSGVARPCPDCCEERLFVPADSEQALTGEYCCTWCGAALLVDPALAPASPPKHRSTDVA